MPPLIDISGKIYGRLTVIKRDGILSLHPAWLCRCSCGNEKRFRASDLKLGKVLSCGCYRNEKVREAISVHGDASRSGKRPEYNVWLAMRSRCQNPNNKDFRHYGGRGIYVCERWESYANFIEDMGGRPTDKHTIDRKNVNGNYEPENCRWATWSEQRKNTRAYKQAHGEIDDAAKD